MYESRFLTDEDEERLIEAARLALMRAADSDVTSGKHQVVLERSWWDEYPDELSISIQINDVSGQAFTVFIASAAWMNSTQLDEISEFLNKCKELVDEHNSKLTQ